MKGGVNKAECVIEEREEKRNIGKKRGVNKVERGVKGRSEQRGMLSKREEWTKRNGG